MNEELGSDAKHINYASSADFAHKTCSFGIYRKNEFIHTPRNENMFELCMGECISYVRVGDPYA